MRQLLFALVLLMGVVAAPSAEAGPPALRQGTEFGPDSETALVIFEVAPPHGVVAPWDLELYGFNPETRRWTMTLTRGWSDFGTLGFGRFYAGLVVPAGIYAVNSVKTQNFWIACMNGGTIAFNLQAGHVNYLGVLDPSDALTQIASGLPHATRGNAVLPSMTRRGLATHAQRICRIGRAALKLFLLRIIQAFMRPSLRQRRSKRRLSRAAVSSSAEPARLGEPGALARRGLGVGFEEALHAIEEALRLRMSLLAAFLGEFFQQLALFRRQIDRGFHRQLNMQIAALA
jgi:hypothetical protein